MLSTMLPYWLLSYRLEDGSLPRECIGDLHGSRRLEARPLVRAHAQHLSGAGTCPELHVLCAMCYVLIAIASYIYATYIHMLCTLSPSGAASSASCISLKALLSRGGTGAAPRRGRARCGEGKPESAPD